MDCHLGFQALFWLDSWDGHASILSIHSHLHAFYQNFSVVGWDTVDHYKIRCDRGLALSFHWKHPSEWPPRGSKDDRKELVQILQARECTNLIGNGILAWESSDLFGTFLVFAGYVELLR